MLDGRVSVDQEFCDFDERRRFSDCLYGEENAGVHGTFEAIDVVSLGFVMLTMCEGEKLRIQGGRSRSLTTS